MIRLDDGIVERVAVRQQDVEVAVAIEVHHLDARRAPVRMRGRVDHLGREADLRRAVVDERHHLLELLREDRHEIHPAVPVQVDGIAWIAPGRGSTSLDSKDGCE